jgi:hypothetical protein
LYSHIKGKWSDVLSSTPLPKLVVRIDTINEPLFKRLSAHTLNIVTFLRQDINNRKREQPPVGNHVVPSRPKKAKIRSRAQKDVGDMLASFQA